MSYCQTEICKMNHNLYKKGKCVCVDLYLHVQAAGQWPRVTCLLLQTKPGELSPNKWITDNYPTSLHFTSRFFEANVSPVCNHHLLTGHGCWTVTVVWSLHQDPGSSCQQIFHPANLKPNATNLINRDTDFFPWGWIINQSIYLSIYGWIEVQHLCRVGGTRWCWFCYWKFVPLFKSRQSWKWWSFQYYNQGCYIITYSWHLLKVPFQPLNKHIFVHEITWFFY